MLYYVLIAIAASILAPISPLAACVLLPVAYKHARISRDNSPMFWLMSAWLLWLPITLFWSISPGFSIQYLSTLLCLPLGWMAGKAIAAREGALRFDQLFLPTLGLLLITFIVWGVSQGPDTATGKPQGPFNDPNAFSASISILFLPILAWYLDSNPEKLNPANRCLILALLGSAFFVQFLIASRGAFLALALILPLLLILARKRPFYRRKLILLAVVALTAFLFTKGLTPNSIGHRLAVTVVEGDSPRLMLMRSALDMALEQPWLGTGLGSFRLRYPLFRDINETGSAGGWVHNDFLQAWVEAGIPFLLILVGVVIWVTWTTWLISRRTKNGRLTHIGYHAAVIVVLLHAALNFLLYFAFIGLLLGLFLARADLLPAGASSHPAAPHPRAYGMIVAGYALIVGYLLIGQVMVQLFLEDTQRVQRVLLERKVHLTRYEIAYWLSIVSPFHPSPPQIMGIELANAYLLTGGGNPAIASAALDYMDEAWRLAQCHLPFTLDALEFVQQNRNTPHLKKRGETIAARMLSCDPRRGVGYYYAGLLADSPANTLERWHTGLVKCQRKGDVLLLRAAILSVTSGEENEKYADLANQLARRIRNYGDSAHNSVYDAYFWSQTENALAHAHKPPPLQ